ncbi:UbiD family decarboxylase [Paradesulfitobacterium ferrireducens]|uniref:UbiD family decarboxylase n=1 Tax=Paradesulfitobacterium ferrireducens TaxID=2816476 RepID=UPI001A904334|nr:UbiD family decarboxylase [Paradesulfitobacterium ferrireducens]
MSETPKSEIVYQDLREWIEEAKKLGELKVVEGATWEQDIGMATEMLHHSTPSPAVIFDKIPGVEPGYRVITNTFGDKRMNMTLGFPTTMNKVELSVAFNDRMKSLKPIPYQVVETGPVMENVIMGDDINILKFPTPLWHEHDGGRYIGTGSYDITIDPDENWVNLGTYRVMVHDEKHLGFYISPGKHGRIHRDKFFARNQPCPVAVVVGGDPLLYLMACNEVPYGTSEYELAGALRGKPYEVIEGKVTGLPIPANAEIVLEGYAYPNVQKMEGPFGEWTGYYASGEREEPVIEVKAIYHRNHPIILGSPPNRPPDELVRYRSIVRSGLLKEELEKAGVPDIVGAWAHEVGGVRMFVAVSIKQRYPGHARQAGHIAAMCHVGAYAGKYVVVVDEDIDPSDLGAVIWAMSTRSDPAESIDIIKRAWSTPLDPRISPDQKAQGNHTNSRAVIDATRPWEWRNEFPRVNYPSPEITKLAREKFGYLLNI